MEAQELFRRLGAGARFDVRRFGQDARRFGVRCHRRGEAGIGLGPVPSATRARRGPSLPCGGTPGLPAALP